MKDAARAAELAERVKALEARLLALSRLLPREYLHLLEDDLGSLPEGTSGASFLEGVEDSHVLVTSEVARELDLVWARLAPEDGNA